MFGLGVGEVLIILVFALIFIGPKKLPGLAKSIGKGLREFQRAKDGLMDQINHPEDHPDDEDEVKNSKDKASSTPPGIEQDIEAEFSSKKNHSETD